MSSVLEAHRIKAGWVETGANERTGIDTGFTYITRQLFARARSVT